MDIAKPLPTSANANGGVVLAGLTKRYAHGTAAVDNVDLRIESGSY